MFELILGCARSGKSGYAEKCALDNQQRDDNIEVIDEPLQLANVLLENANGDKSIVVDCLTLWLSNLLLKNEDKVETCDVLR